MLSHEEIVRYIEKQYIFIDPFDISRLGANSYDVCLGNWFIPLLGWKKNKPVYGDFEYIPDGQCVSIPNNHVLLGMTKERIGSRNNITPQIMTRSTVERMGIDVCKSAGLGDIGYYDQHWTVELTAHYPDTSEEPASLVVGSRFAQVVFHPNESGVITEHAYSGQYSLDDWPLCILPKEYRDDYWVEYEYGAIVACRRKPDGNKVQI